MLLRAAAFAEGRRGSPKPCVLSTSSITMVTFPFMYLRKNCEQFSFLDVPYLVKKIWTSSPIAVAGSVAPGTPFRLLDKQRLPCGLAAFQPHEHLSNFFKPSRVFPKATGTRVTHLLLAVSGSPRKLRPLRPGHDFIGRV